MISRKKSPFSDQMLKLCATCQLVLEIDSSSGVNSIVDYFKNTVYALRIKKNGEYLERHNDLKQIPTYLFPYKVNNSFNSVEDVSNYVHEKIPLDLSKGEGFIAHSPQSSSRQYVALSIPHGFADGKYFVYLIDQFFNPKSVKSLLHLPDFPYYKYDSYKKYYDCAPSDVKDDMHNEKLTRFSTNNKSELKLNASEEFDKFVTLRFKAEELKNAIVKQNDVLVKSFTESLYLANYFTICAHEKKLLNSFGVINVVDLKKYFDKGPISFANGSEIGFVSPHIDNISPENKNIEIAQKMRKSLLEKLSKNEQFSVLASAKYNQSLPKLNGIVTEFSNIGGFHIRKPITDLWFALDIKSLNRETVSNMGFSVIRDDFDSYNENEKENKSRNDMVLRYRYSPKKLSSKETLKIAKSIEFFLKNISFDDFVGKSFEKISDFYNSI